MGLTTCVCSALLINQDVTHQKMVYYFDFEWCNQKTHCSSDLSKFPSKIFKIII